MRLMVSSRTGIMEEAVLITLKLSVSYSAYHLMQEEQLTGIGTCGHFLNLMLDLVIFIKSNWLKVIHKLSK